MLIWTGWGILCPILLFGGIFLGEDFIHETYGDGIGLAIAAVVNFFIARKVNNPANDRIVVDEQTGERLAIKKRSTLFWIPMEWWSAVMLVLSVVNIFN